MDEQRAEAAKSRAQEFESGNDQDRDQYMAIWAALRRSTLRLEAVRRYERQRTAQERLINSFTDRYAILTRELGIDLEQ
jgi:hypothetical protein